ncbi:hypothetical protein [Chamaesiphon polymorphus]|uniref:Uncharacterized protein n=1 Tax=Chamaesiphon polymorphus CCALA 037 TaxID=2107692 RepID=A0A2T1F955_9CYAN|nr:hypothetical protein [Chamaesiphon polymorphus]PSB41448.1 hypothetical protein C7B77_27410 [Chamaesiphon polymorphus CCALA 037]
MTTKKPAQNPPEETITDGIENYDRPTPDSYDPHIIPAETAARKEREGENYKHLPEHPPGSESLDTTGGFVIDKEGLVDNLAIEPEMYYETPGDIPEEQQLKQNL